MINYFRRYRNKQSNLVLPSDFDSRAYLELNPDVAASLVDAAKHYLQHGHEERRPYRFYTDLPDDFDPVTYLALNVDLKGIEMTPEHHYRVYGGREKRPYKVNGKLPDDFDSDLYSQLNPDVVRAGIAPELHYLAFGSDEAGDTSGPKKHFLRLSQLIGQIR